MTHTPTGNDTSAEAATTLEAVARPQLRSRRSWSG